MIPLNGTLEKFNTVSLQQVGSDNLLTRFDTKFSFHSDLLEPLLKKLSENYEMLSVNNTIAQTYSNIYFDNRNLECYFFHHNNRLERWKFRYRIYESSNKIFFELKRKSHREQTQKERVLCMEASPAISGAARELVEAASHFNAADLVPCLYVNYKRLTLVSQDRTERMTIDCDLKISHENKAINFDHLVIAELKRPLNQFRSSGFEAMRSLGIRSGAISKYCLGIIHTRPGIKYNAFKRRITRINRIIQNGK
jgi:hypothetical protein